MRGMKGKLAGLGTMGLVAGALVLAGAVDPEDTVKTEQDSLLLRMADLTFAAGEHHMGSGNCVLCHGPDPVAMQDAEGNDVSVVTHWQSTMMANSAKDPFWRAKVAHEGLVNPDYVDEIANVCTGCHAPAGHHEAHWAGDDLYNIADLEADEMGLDGVNCTSCHTINDDSLRWRFNGDLPTNEDRVIWGPFTPQVTMPMQMNVDYTPTASGHMLQSEVCAPCHSLYTHTFDLEGQPTDGVFFEQSTYLEWLNSSYPEDNVECQTCHMPRLPGGTILSDRPPWLGPNPLGQHHLVGGNAFMLKVLRDNAVALDLSASTVQFDSTIARTERMLQQHSANLLLTPLDAPTGEYAFEVEVENLAGHKFPTGYPSRLTFLEFILRDSTGTELFHSGDWTEAEGIAGRDEPFEPHWNEILTDDQVQVYEMVFADVSGTPSTVLDRAASVLKDNRIAPAGFSTEHMSYDTAAFGPAAALDADFNRFVDGTEGSGSDRLTYRITPDGYTGAVTAEVTLHYLALPARWVEEMFGFAADAEAIADFQAMFNAADRTPVEVVKVWWPASAVGVSEVLAPAPGRLVPNPASDRVRVDGVDVARAWLLDSTGRTIREFAGTQAALGIDLTDLAAGVFFVRIETRDGREHVLRGVKG